jgi:ribosome-associated protein
MAVLRTEGEDNGEWIIVDCGAAVAHIMQPAVRQYYNLEEIWGGKSVHMKVDAGAAKKMPAARKQPAANKAPARKVSAKSVPAKKPAVRKPAAKKAPAKKAAPRATRRKA